MFPRWPKSLKTLGSRLLVVRNSCNGTFPLSTPMSKHDELGSRLGRTIDLPHHTCHLSKRFRIDGIKAMSSGILGGKQVNLLPRVFSLSNMAAVGEKIAGKNVSIPHSQQDWWKSSEPARCTYNLQPTTWLSGKFPSRLICPNITRQNGCGLRAKFRPSVEVGGGESSSYITAILDIKSPQTPSVELSRRSVFVHHQQQGSLWA